MDFDKYRETELKLYVDDLSIVAEKLDFIGARLTQPRVFERNVRYEDANHSLTAQGIVIRLRRDRGIRLTYKEPIAQSDETIRSRFEAEVEVSDYDTMDTILRKLGYIPYVVYEKYRATYVIDDTEVVLDEMPYGSFVEIEGTLSAIRSVRDRLGLQDAFAFQSNYLQLFDNVRRNLHLDVHDLTFKNFEGVDVPFGAFQAQGEGD